MAIGGACRVGEVNAKADLHTVRTGEKHATVWVLLAGHPYGIAATF